MVWAGVTRVLEDAGGGEVLEDFVRAAAAVDAVALGDESVELEGEVEGLERERAGVEERLAEAKGRFRKLDGGDAAAVLAGEVAALEATVREAAEEWLRVRVARSMLSAGAERYREANEGVLVARAGELFAELTGGSFEGIGVDYSAADEAVLVGVREGGGRVGVEGMSEGTADQLYLALRLAALEGHLAEVEEPLPLVVDDLFITFDDVRARAVLRVLGKLAQRMQVIVFTHHRHLVELASEVFGDRGLHIGELPGR